MKVQPMQKSPATAKIIRQASGEPCMAQPAITEDKTVVSWMAISSLKQKNLGHKKPGYSYLAMTIKPIRFLRFFDAVERIDQGSQSGQIVPATAVLDIPAG